MHAATLIRTTMLAAAAVLTSLVAQPWQSSTDLARAATPLAAATHQFVTQISDTPAGRQLRWVLDQVNGDAAALEETEVTARFAPAFLAGLPPAQLLQLLRETAVEHGPISVTGIAGRPSETGMIALIETQTGERAAIYLNVEASPPHRIISLELSEPPGPPASAVATPGPYTGSFDIGGRRLFLTCAGEGSPTVVLEAGAGGGAAAWTTVQPALARVTRVCSYDRANVPGGASDPVPKPRSGADVVADLHALLTAAGVPGPYVLAGHSLGGLYVRLYASHYPESVVGLVLVDAAHEDQEARLAALLQPLLPAMPPAAEPGEAAFVERVGDEQVDFAASAAQVRAARAAAPLRPMPLIVLAHGVADAEPGTPPEIAEAQERLWRELQADLAHLAPNGQILIAEGSGHVIQEDQPELVITALREVVDAVRQMATRAADGES